MLNYMDIQKVISKYYNPKDKSSPVIPDPYMGKLDDKLAVLR